MKKSILAAAAGMMALGTYAQAADLPNTKAPVPAPVVASPWDFQVGGGLTSNYIFRGISQSNNGPSVNALGELRYNFTDMWQGYVGVAGESIKLTNIDVSPSMELDVYGGVRGTFGNFTTDVGAWGYLYPGLGSTPTLGTTAWGPVWLTNPSWYEVYGKAGYNFTDSFNVGANVFYTPSYLDTGAQGTYVSGTFKATLGDFSLSGELGRQFLGTPDAVHATVFPAVMGTKLPDYTYGNIGVSYSYKFVTLDLRFHDTSLSKSQCAMITAPTTLIATAADFTPANYTSKYCGAAVVGTISFALQAKDLK